MKKVFSILTATCVILSLFAISGVCAHGADELTVNSKAKAKVGDRVKYVLYLADTEEEIEGFQMELNYDPEFLETDSEKINFPETDAVVKNIVNGEVLMNWTNVFNKLNFSTKKEFFDIEFTVKKGGETEISKFVKEIYGDDMTYLKSYTWTYDLKINDEPVIVNEPPVITSKDEVVKANQGAYINFLDGKGEKNSPLKDDHPAVTDPDSALLKNRDSAAENHVGETFTANQYGTYIQDVTRYVDKDNPQGGFPVWIIGIISVVVIAGFVVGAIVISKKKH
ncbi:MAG TPA: hypothetical protein DEO32_00800 [Ruminococcaceae bacterium]|nr:hypothetical protein [Oscillospiraceae bacterium]